MNGTKIAFLILAIAMAKGALGYDRIYFQTPFDRFTLTKGKTLLVEGKPVQGTLMKELDPLLTGSAEEECPKDLPKATFIAVTETKGQKDRREFFVGRGIVRIGDHCLSVSGNGLYALPLHRSWLIGPFRNSVKIESPVKVSQGDTVLASVAQTDGTWTDTDPKGELDSDFWDRFRDSLSDYQVLFRLSLEGAKDKSVVTLQSGAKTYRLYHLEPQVWGIESPDHKWIEASADWSFWFELDESMWRDRWAAVIAPAEAPGATKEQKDAVFAKAANSWSRTLEGFYARRLLDTSEDGDLRLKALSRLRSHPSWRNMATIIRLLQSSPNDELLRLATLALRARNPSGPLFTAEDSDRAQVIKEWLEWWSQNSHRND